MARNRNNPLALAVLYCLLERPMHPYEVATTLRQRFKERSVKLNYGALYAVVESLRKRALIEPVQTERPGRLPERTIYQLTGTGRTEVSDWLADLIATPATEYPQFVAALSFLPALPPEQAVDLLRQRLQHLDIEDAQAAATRELVHKRGLPRLFLVDDEYRDRLRAAEIELRPLPDTRHRIRHPRRRRLVAPGPPARLRAGPPAVRPAATPRHKRARRTR